MNPVESIIRKIHSGELIQEDLNNLPIDKLTKVSSNKLLLQLVKIAAEKDRLIQLIEIVNEWDTRTDSQFTCQFTIFLSDLDDRIIKYVCSKLIFRPLDLLADYPPVYNLIEVTRDTMVKWLKLYGSLICTVNVEEVSNQLIHEQCIFAKKPTWIKQQSELDVDPEFRKLGPFNEGIRMLADDVIEDEDEEYEDWFGEKCLCCSTFIGDRRWALREPVEYGWDGCYCSWKCVRTISRIRNRENKELVKQLEDELNTLGLDM